MSNDEKTPVRTPSGLHKIGQVRCPKCCPKNSDGLYICVLHDCFLCIETDGTYVRVVPIDVAIRWQKEPHKNRFDIEADIDKEERSK